MKLELFTEDELDRLDLATLTVLDRAGVLIQDHEILAALEKMGARVDRATMIARLPERLVREVLPRGCFLSNARLQAATTSLALTSISPSSCTTWRLTSGSLAAASASSSLSSLARSTTRAFLCIMCS